MRFTRSLLVVGLDVASISSSAKNAGYNVFSVNYFGDSDLLKSCLLSLSIVTQRENASHGWLNQIFNPKDFLVLARKLVEKNEVDGILLSSGLDDYPQILSELNNLAPIIGNSPEIIKRVRNKKSFFTELDSIGVPHPETEMVENLDEAEAIAGNMGYPIVIKPEKGFGGNGLRKVSSAKNLRRTLRSVPFCDSFLVQEYIEGKAASASVISTSSKALTLTINEQFLGKHDLGQKEPFGYCGNIVPLKASTPTLAQCKEIVEKVVSHFNLAGTNGVDFVITNKGLPKVVEVNPRFQGTLECVERVFNINLVKAHIDACTLRVLPTVGKTQGFCVRLVLYALKRSKIPMLDMSENIRDVPFKDVIVEEGEPICSVVAEGQNKTLALRKARILADSIYRSIHETSI